MHSSGFAHAPVTRLLIVSLITTSVLATLSDTKHYFPITAPYLLRYNQWWRLLTWPLAYLNSSELLFGTVTLYQLRVIERLWGSAKFAVRALRSVDVAPRRTDLADLAVKRGQSFLAGTFAYTALLSPLVVLLVLRPLSLGKVSLLPAGPTALIFAVLAQYHAAIPYTYRYRVTATGSGSDSPNSSHVSADEDGKEDGVLLTSKSLSYLLPAQLALAQLPGSLVPAVVGWLVGYAWRAEVLPLPRKTWRLPGWVVGGKAGGTGAGDGGVQDLRRRMREEMGGGEPS